MSLAVVSPAKEGSWLAAYGAAVLATGAAVVLRMALAPLIGATSVPFITFFPAVLFAAWYGGFRAAAFGIVLSTLAANYYFFPPVREFVFPAPDNRIELLVFVIISLAIAGLSYSQRRALEQAGRETARRKEAENAEREQRRRFETTLASIGDGVISTDAQGRIVFTNQVAESLLRWPKAEMLGRHLDEVFRIVNEYTRATVESPVARILREGAIVGMANHTVLIARDGTEVPIDDSAAPIYGEDNAIRGTVLVFRDTGARRLAEQTSHLLASIVESSEDAIISKDLEGVITSWNRGAEKMFGYSADETIGRPISVIAVPGRNEMPGILGRIKRGERVENYETIRQTKGGKVVHVSITVSPMRDASGRIVGASKVARDITQRVRAAEELARSNAEFQKARDSLRTTLESIGDAVISTDAQGLIVFTNKVAESLLQWPEADMLGKHLDEVFRIVNEYTRATVESPVARVLREGAVVGMANHTVLIARDGTEVRIDDSAAPIRDESGAIRGTVMVFRDVRERRRTERELRENAEALRIALEAGRMGVWEWTVATNKVSWSPTLEAIHGLSPGSFGGTFEDYLSDVHPEDLVAVKQAIVGSLEERTGHDIEYRIVWPDGSLHWIQGKGRVVLDASGNTVGMTGVCMDITIRKRAEEEIRAANAALLRSNEDLERFAFVASHDLQEPLRMISAYAQLLVKEYPGLFQGDAAAFVGNIIEGAKRIRELLVDLLAYAEIRGASQGPLEVVDLNLVVENVKLTLKTAVDESGAVINSDRLPVLRGHAGHFVPLFQNLIGNALKYRSERPPWIDVSVQEQDGQLRFSVADNGIGIAEEFHDKIFVVFKRLHGRDIPGTGIGLAICQRVVERYGGRIWVESQVGRGSTFFFTIPIRASVSRGEN